MPDSHQFSNTHIVLNNSQQEINTYRNEYVNRSHEFLWSIVIQIKRSVEGLDKRIILSVNPPTSNHWLGASLVLCPRYSLAHHHPQHALVRFLFLYLFFICIID